MESTSEDHSKCYVPATLVDFIEKRCEGDKEGLEPCSHFFCGVCLLVDISGFSKLSGECCSLGRAGIEELKLATNGYVGSLVEIIYSCGGEVIKFAGGTIICVFSSSFATGLPSVGKYGSHHRTLHVIGDQELDSRSKSGSSEPLLSKSPPQEVAHTSPLLSVSEGVAAEVIHRAMHCAQRLCEVETSKLAVRVAMSCGEMCFGILGGVENRWECLISGPCIHELSDCLSKAPSKTAVMTRACADIVLQVALVSNRDHAAAADDCTASDREVSTPPSVQATSFLLKSGHYTFELQFLPSCSHRIVRVEFSASTKNTSTAAPPNPSHRIVAEDSRRGHTLAQRLIRQFVPVPIAADVEVGRDLNITAEIREVTTMFMKWDSYDAETKHRDLMALQTSFFSAQEILHSTGAYLQQFLVDDKGCVLIACWGVPHLSYLDNAHRALSAASQIRHKLKKQDMACSFGITTGDVYCGTVGSALRMEYAAIGSVVNMAERLMCKAEGGILVDDATHSRLPCNVADALKALAPMEMKGCDEPLQVHEYVSAGSVHVKDRIVEDHEIPVSCREALLRLLDCMAANMPLVPTALLHKAAAPSTAATTPLRVVLIKGKEGLGRTTVVKWLHQQAYHRRVCTYSVCATHQDARTDYAVWTRLFHLMAPRELFICNDTQRSFVRTLLSNIYSDAPQVAQYIGFPVLRSVLGFTCTYSTSFRHTRQWPGWLQSKRSTSFSDNAAPSSHQVLEVMHHVFAYLLNEQTSLFIIENVELCDECSLKLLLSLRKVVTHSSIVLTALEGAEVEEINGSTIPTNRLCSHLRRTDYRRKALKHTPWAREYEPQLMAAEQAATRGMIASFFSSVAPACEVPVTVLTLANYSSDEIDQMLCAALRVATAPPEVFQLVQYLSEGSYLWVRELIWFIKEHGPMIFLFAVSDKDSSGGGKPFAVQEVMPSIGKNLTRSASSLKLVGRSPGKTASSRQLLRGASFCAPIAANRAAESPRQVQLNKLMLCRFGTLPADEQHVLCSASIIGATFTSTVLLNIVEPQLCDRLLDLLQSLLDQRWLCQDSNNEVVYQFANPHAHQMVYELTPFSERMSLHLQIAESMETALSKGEGEEDKAQYESMSFHFQQSGCAPQKALFYLSRTVNAVLQQVTSIYDFGDCLDLMAGCAAWCASSQEVDAVLMLVNGIRVMIREFKLGAKTAAAPQTWFRRLLAAVFIGRQRGSRGSGGRRVVPGNNCADSSYLEEFYPDSYAYAHSAPSDCQEELSGTSASHSFPSLTSSTGAAASSAKRGVTDAAEEERRAKRVFLQQVSRLYDELNERYVNLANE